jgi:hypothetical protein
MIPVEYVQPGFSLAIDRGQCPQLFQVENVGFQLNRQDDGSCLNTFTLTSNSVAAQRGITRTLTDTTVSGRAHSFSADRIALAGDRWAP